MSVSMQRWVEQQASARARRGLARELVPRAPGADLLDLASNDYLGLATHTRLALAAAEATALWGTGATSSRLVTGTTLLHEQLERELARLVGLDTALVYSSGYLANMGVLTALGGPGTLIVADAHAHASMIDGFRLSRSRTETFAHNDLDDAERLLGGRSEPRALIAVESIFSVFGDEAPLAGLLALAERHDAMLVVDEAHSVGVAGHGRGSIAGTALAGHPSVIVTATLSKALGSQGGAVLGPDWVRSQLVNRSRSFIFDTGLAPASAAAALAAIDVIRDEPWRVERLRANATALSTGLAAVLHGTRLAIDPGAGAVQSIPLPTAEIALSCARAARAAGIQVGCFRPPSVPDGVSRLRLTARATLTRPVPSTFSAPS
ncbi:8-amino-7-oxononanoate synthase [Cryobacterium sp. PH31-O1]|uniref:8-amino-7-oxononanoate synthase n=1 Tax=Cryobacterium sp. PH31-O1 TaxID=3046306 RepID=UPI0024BBBB71|nr:8-amino-7-oxononanoate synthase [Cryobacterium sp. PH31-O1]MDJ0339571.1 8-amino-7-oxononanoate synthase [Cryobacterium sp. PH31-O1]